MLAVPAFNNMVQRCPQEDAGSAADGAVEEAWTRRCGMHVECHWLSSVVSTEPIGLVVLDVDDW